MSELKRENTYDIFKKLIKKINVKDISELIFNDKKLFHLPIPKISNNKNLYSFFMQEFKNIKDNEKRTYIIHQPPYYSFPLILTSKYLFLVNCDLDFVIYDNNLEYFFDLGLNSINSLKTKKYSYNQEFYISDNYLNFYYKTSDNVYNKDTFFFRIDKNVLLKYTKDKNKKYSFIMNSSNPITSIKYNKNEIITYFRNSLYSSIIMDYNFNILDVKFHALVSKHNDFNTNVDMKNLKNYSDFIHRLKDSLEIYKLTYDKDFKLKINEKKFNNHINFIKKFTKNKKTIDSGINSILNSFLNVDLYRKNLSHKTFYLYKLLNFDFYSCLPINITKKFEQDPFDILLMKDQINSNLILPLCQIFLFLLLHEDNNNHIIEPDLISNVLNIKKDSNNISYLMNQ